MSSASSGASDCSGADCPNVKSTETTAAASSEGAENQNCKLVDNGEWKMICQTEGKLPEVSSTGSALSTETSTQGCGSMDDCSSETRKTSTAIYVEGCEAGVDCSRTEAVSD